MDIIAALILIFSPVVDGAHDSTGGTGYITPDASNTVTRVDNVPAQGLSNIPLNQPDL